MIIGSDMTPMLTGQVDVVTGWLTNTTALKPLGPTAVDLRLWDAGVRLYALPLLRHQGHDREEARRCWPASCARLARLGIRAARTATKAADMLVKEYPNLKRADELEGSKVLLDLRLQRQHQGQRLGRLRSGGLAGPDRAL